jgi:hypothetical protein
MMPMDNSTDPPFRDLTSDNVEGEYGAIERMSSTRAYDVLCAVIRSPPWMHCESSDNVLRQLIVRAKLTNDVDVLTDLGLENFVVTRSTSC